jgi:spoIIIJ-associated protein
MEKYKYESKSKENLLSLACDDLKVTEDDILYNITEEKKGLFGKKYYIEIIKINDVAEYGKSLIIDFLKGFNLKGNVEIKVRDKSITYKIFTDNNAILIGKRGHILESLQNFVRGALLNSTDIFVNVIIDIENYKEKQIYFLEKKVKKLAREVTLTKSDIKLDPMNSYDRRIIHNALSGFDYIETVSEGEEPNRCVVIKYKGKK